MMTTALSTLLGIDSITPEGVDHGHDLQLRTGTDLHLTPEQGEGEAKELSALTGFALILSTLIEFGDIAPDEPIEIEIEEREVFQHEELETTVESATETAAETAQDVQGRQTTPVTPVLRVELTLTSQGVERVSREGSPAEGEGPSERASGRPEALPQVARGRIELRGDEWTRSDRTTVYRIPRGQPSVTPGELRPESPPSSTSKPIPPELTTEVEILPEDARAMDGPTPDRLAEIISRLRGAMLARPRAQPETDEPDRTASAVTLDEGSEFVIEGEKDIKHLTLPPSPLELDESYEARSESAELDLGWREGSNERSHPTGGMEVTRGGEVIRDPELSRPGTMEVGVADRVARVLELQDEVASQPISRVSVRIEGEDGVETRVRLGLRSSVIDAEIIPSDRGLADRLLYRVDELSRALERHGLTPGTIQVEEGGATVLSTGTDGRSALMGEREEVPERWLEERGERHPEDGLDHENPQQRERGEEER